jgi:hypothetical protein
MERMTSSYNLGILMSGNAIVRGTKLIIKIEALGMR